MRWVTIFVCLIGLITYCINHSKCAASKGSMPDPAQNPSPEAGHACLTA